MAALALTMEGRARVGAKADSVSLAPHPGRKGGGAEADAADGRVGPVLPSARVGKDRASVQADPASPPLRVAQVFSTRSSCHRARVHPRVRAVPAHRSLLGANRLLRDSEANPLLPVAGVLAAVPAVDLVRGGKVLLPVQEEARSLKVVAAVAEVPFPAPWVQAARVLPPARAG